MSVRPPGSGISDVPSTGPLAHPEQPAKLETPELNDQDRKAEGKPSSAIALHSPQMSVRKSAESPLAKPPASPKPLADESESLQPSWVENIPLDVRLRVLNEVVSQPGAEAAQRDLANYAQTSKIARADVREYHRLARDPRASLLASKNLARDAWQTAKQNWFGKAEAFQSALKTAAAGYSAIHLDGRYGIADFADYTPAAVSAVLESNIDHLHLKIGYPYYQSVLPARGALACIKALSDGCMKRLGEGKPLPSIYLHIDGIPIEHLAAALRKSPVRLNILGLSVCSYRANAELESTWPGKSVNEIMKLVQTESSDLESWHILFNQLSGIRYLHLSGWTGYDPIGELLDLPGQTSDPLGAALRRFVRKSNSLEELHFSKSVLTLQNYGPISISISKNPRLKRIVFDYVGYADLKVRYRGLGSAQVLERNPNLILVEKADVPVALHPRLEQYRREGRYQLNGYPQTMRDLPEIYSKVDFFKPAS